MGGGTAHPTGTLGDLLSSRRRALFVGRDGELELFRAALEAADPRFRVLFIHGPGGVGKSALLDVYADLARQAGWDVVRIDGHDVGDPAGLESVIQGWVSPGGQAVVLIDAFELLAAMELHVREVLLPRLPASTVIVIAGRDPPTVDWRSDLAWIDVLRVISLRNLESSAAARFLAARGVPPHRHAEVLALSHSHPLALGLLADILGVDPGAELRTMPPDPTRLLLGRMVDLAPTRAHQDALRVYAIARTTSQGLLASALATEERAAEVFDWLAALSVTDVTSDGVRPHDLVRDLLDADLRWRDANAYRAVFRAINAHALERARRTRGREQQRAVADAKFIFRNVRGVLSPVVWERWGDHYPDRARREDRDTILELVRRAEGAESAELAERWLGLQPEAFHVVRTAEGGVRGVVTVLALTRCHPSDREADPGAAAAWRFAEANAPVRQGDTVYQTRFIVDRDVYQDPSPTLNAVPILTLQQQLVDRRLSWDFLTLAEPDRWDHYFALAGLPRAAGADFVVGGRRYGLFCHDFRRVPIEVVTQQWAEVALTDDALSLPVPDVPPEAVVLSFADFERAARQALHDLRRPDLLARSPLLRSCLVAAAAPEDRVNALATVIRQAVDALAVDPRDDKFFRAVRHTYVHGAGTQEAAAAQLGLPFSTYRRHLHRGVERVVAGLWHRELGEDSGAAGGPEHW